MAHRAVTRVNLMDAVLDASGTWARANTALVRIGQVAVVNANGTVDVTLGGATFPAQRFTGSSYVVGDVVAVLTDTDAWWVLGKIATS